MMHISLRKITLLVSVLVILISSNGFSSTHEAFDLERLVKDADHIVVGRVIDSVFFSKANRIMTLHRIEILDALVTNLQAGEILEVITEGGKLGRIRQAVSGAAELEQDKEYLFFLEYRGNNDFAYVIGMSQGAYPITVDSLTKTKTIRPPDNLPRLLERDKTKSGRLVESSFWLKENKPLDDIANQVRKIARGLK